MSTSMRILIGLAAVLLMGWLWHGPAGRGEAFVGTLEAQARTAVEAGGLPGIDVRLEREPLSRTAVLSGEANDFQREGMGSLPGLTDRVAEVEGIGAVNWADREPAGSTLPLLAETLLLLLLAYAVGLGLGALLFGRKPHEGFL